jgi:hypothetical protein
MPTSQLVINVYGGLVQEVFCSDSEIEVLLVDWDVEPAEAAHPSVVHVPADDRRSQPAYVTPLPVQALDALQGTRIAAAIDVAELTAC